MKAMRIFYAVMPTPNGVSLRESRLWRSNLYASLVRMGHEVIEFDYDMLPVLMRYTSEARADRAFVEVERANLEQALLSQVTAAHREHPIDLFFSYFYDCCARPEAIVEIRHMGIPTANFYCNAVHQFSLVQRLAPAYDICWVPESAALYKYRAVGAKPLHLQMAANPSIYRPFEVPREYDITFVGQKYGNRPLVIDHLLRRHFQVRVWGPGWAKEAGQSLPPTGAGAGGGQRQSFLARTSRAIRSPGKIVDKLYGLPRQARLKQISGPCLSDEESVLMFSRSNMSLGFSVVAGRAEGAHSNRHVRLRDFEGPMSRALYAAEWSEDLPKCYEPDREVLVFHSAEELADKAKYYLAHPEEAEKIRAAGYRRALSEHTWEHRFVKLFQALGL